ncbi:hypothetical protein VE01_07354 [Pseudogymnoascus verrucosus]|uniref:UBC core domain-containing protein n=1 Tax=Pseudogymnoascus verrucosus TaxID=342668 RepID=A0A1B8GGU2_9PEZI|nr:uncharacterized protein VE01_07354 [Pseudogymnoascus verrucosus]OBT95051.1 hypothetical protein VE01_07354 [Pseudogymnoascus verrucosus]
MTRKAFIADVATARNSTFGDIEGVQIGDEGEDFTFVFTTVSGDSVLIKALATDTSAYPKGNTYFLGVESVSAPPAFERELQSIQGSFLGLTVQGLLEKTAATLRSLATGSEEDPLYVDDDDVIMGGSFQDDHATHHGYGGQEDAGDDEDGDEDEDDDNDWSPGSPFSDMFMSSSKVTLDPSILRAIQGRIRQDVTRAKLAGFRIGILAGMRADSTDSILSMSIKVAHLGLSEQAIEAWDLQPHQYIVLLIHYAGPYVTFQKVMDVAVRQLQIEFRIGVSNHYKPCLSDAVAAFSTSRLQASDILSNTTELDENPEETADRKFHALFISSPMNQLLNDRFLSLLKIRKNDGLGWEGAKRAYNMYQSRATMSSRQLVDHSTADEDITKEDLPPIASIDHLEDSEDENYSLPLIAMQFSLRYLIRCTEFCLVCHSKTEDSFEALKPYVCSNPLCLYQYMALGFGPSIEHSVATQPYVVDLLVSFAYASAHARSMRKYPTGMGLVVAQPVPNAIVQFTAGAPSTSPPKDPPSGESKIPGIHVVDFILGKKEVVMDAEDPCDVVVGDWVEITTQDATQEPGRNVFHFRVASYMHPHMHLINPGLEYDNASSGGIVMPQVIQENGLGGVPFRKSTTASPKDRIRVKLAAFKVKFDELTALQKDATILSLLRNMPSIDDMKAYLQATKASGEPSFRKWTDRMCPAALGLLRWIVASNLSCIVQVDRYPGQPEADALSNNASRLGQRVTNLEGWVQFRFAQGAPDKEQKFHKALSLKKGSISEEFPTLFAWHGSAVHNWHSIIRSGLDFNQIANGRAFGNGCYHSQHFQTSLGYCNSRSGVFPCDAGLRYWSGSNLKISQAICLNEIVNAPLEFTSNNPHLVVQHVDWIQCRYLFVLCGDVPGAAVKGNMPHLPIDSKAIQYIKQDPARKVTGVNGEVLGIPRSAFPPSRTFSIENGGIWAKKPDPPGNRKKKQKHRSLTNIFFKNRADDDSDLTDDSDLEDINFLIDDEESHSKVKANGGPQTDFIPGSLDRSTITLLGSPSYATSAATNMLARDLQVLLKVQSATPLHELGWYIDGDSIDNMYQWIVELHSFDPKLPLAKEMKDAGISSIVLEMRFGKNYPMSPPFVRVIRPRFLPFMAGGGGHVTAGGALCMELLTNSGWSAVSSIESVLLQVRMAISSTDPKPARLTKGGRGDYGVGEAIEAYLRACRAHGWEASNMDDFKSGVASGS